MIYADDGTDNRGLKLEIQKVTKGDTLKVPMKDGGGCAVIFTKEKPSAAETIEFAQDEMTLERNANTTIDVTITPEKPLISSLIWESSDPTVATVDSSGKVTGIRPGTAVITATSPVDDSVSDSCTVTVEMENTPWIAIFGQLSARIASTSPIRPLRPSSRFHCLAT